MSNILYQIFETVQEKKQRGESIIELHVGEPDQKPPLSVIKAANNALKQGKLKYGSSAGELSLRKLIAQKHEVKVDNVVVGPGSKFLIYACLKTLLKNKSDEIILPQPIWGTYESMIKNIGLGKIRFLPTSLKNNWQINLGQLKKLINKKTKLMVLCDPNNPTSTKIKSKIKNQIAKIAQKQNIKIIEDLAYESLIFNPNSCHSALDAAPIKINSSIHIYSFSKSFAMTGFRLGYLIANSTLINQIIKFNQITITCLPQFIQEAGVIALQKETKFSKKLAKIYQKRAKLAEKILKPAGFRFAVPEAGFYLFTQLPHNLGAEKFSLKLLKRGVAVVPGPAFGPFPDFIRLSLTVAEEALVKALRIVKNEV